MKPASRSHRTRPAKIGGLRFGRTALSKTPPRAGVTLLLAFLAAFAPAFRSYPAPGSPEPQAYSETPAVRRILFLGNSITLHGPKADIGWTNNWGMAASAEEKDYVHLVARALARHTGVTPEIRVRNIADFERNYASYDAKERLKEAFAFDADLIVVAIGENVPALVSDADKARFKTSLLGLLRSAIGNRHPTIVVRSCFWPDAAKDQLLREAAEVVKARFVDAGPLGRDPANAARSERRFQHDGVAGHPGDKGMQALADAILKAVLTKQDP